MPIVNFSEVDTALYEFVGGTTDATKGFVSTIFDSAALYMGEIAFSDDAASNKQLFPAVSIQFVSEMPDRVRLHNSTEDYIHSVTAGSVPTAIVSDGPIPYALMYHIHVFSRRHTQDRDFRTRVAGLFQPLGSIPIGDEAMYYEVTARSSMRDDEMYGDQVVFHTMVEIVVYVEVANLQTRSYKQVVQANLEIGDADISLTED